MTTINKSAPATVNMGAVAEETLQQKLDRLELENAKLKADAEKPKFGGGVSAKVSQQGAISAFGIQSFPVTLYHNQWMKLLGESTTPAALAIKGAIKVGEETKTLRLKDETIETYCARTGKPMPKKGAPRA